MSTAALMEKVAEVAPDKYRFIVKMAAEVRESPFRDEIVDQLDAIVKKAALQAPPGMGSRFGGAAAGIGMAVGTAIAYSLAGDMFDATKRGITKGRNYRSMLKENPDLKELPTKNVQQAFSTLHRFNPEFSGDPLVAGSFVRRQAQFPGGEFDANQLSSLVSSHKSLADGKKLQMPGNLPWESHEEKEMRRAQTHHFQGSGDKSQQDMKHRGELHENAVMKSDLDLASSQDDMVKRTLSGGNQPLTARMKARLGSTPGMGPRRKP